MLTFTCGNQAAQNGANDMRCQLWSKPGETYDPLKYVEIAKSAMDTANKPTEISREDYWAKLEVLPPIYVPGGFLVSEAYCDSPMGPVHLMCAERENFPGEPRYFAKMVVRGHGITYIRPGIPACAYPIVDELA